MTHTDRKQAWLAFRNSCIGTVQRILETGDDGVYAKLYAQDVSRLVAALDELDSYLDPEQPPYIDVAGVV